MARLVLLAVLALTSLASLTLHGCTIGGVKRSGAVRRPPVAPPTIYPAADPRAPGPTQASEANQSGMVNAAIQGIKGIEINEAMPLGVAALLGFTNLSMMALLCFITFLSHRRELLRLKRGGLEPPEFWLRRIIRKRRLV